MALRGDVSEHPRVMDLGFRPRKSSTPPPWPPREYPKSNEVEFLWRWVSVTRLFWCVELIEFSTPVPFTSLALFPTLYVCILTLSECSQDQRRGRHNRNKDPSFKDCRHNDRIGEPTIYVTTSEKELPLKEVLLYLMRNRERTIWWKKMSNKKANDNF